MSQHPSTTPIPSSHRETSTSLVGVVCGLLSLLAPARGGSGGAMAGLHLKFSPVWSAWRWGSSAVGGNPVVHALHSAYFAEFAQRIAECFASLFSTACTTQDTWDQRRGKIASDLMKTELALDHTIVHHHLLESDEQSQVDQFTSCSGTPPALSFPPVSTIVNHSTAYPNSRGRGRGRVGMPSNNCGQIGCSSGAVRNPACGTGCYSGLKLSQWKASCTSKTQSPRIKRDGESSQPGTASAPLTPSANPLFGTVQIVNRAGQFRLLKAEVDLESPCTIISRQFLDRCLPKTPVDALKEIPKSCN